MRRTDKLTSLILCLTMLIAMLSFSMAFPQYSYAQGSPHYIAVASDRHETPSAIRTAMGGMPSSVEYVCLNGDMANFDREHRPGQNPYNTSTVLDEVLDVFPALNSSVVSIIYAGHDSNATDDAGIIRNADTSMLPAPDAKDAPEISRGWSELIYTGEGSSYYIYGVSFQDMGDADDAEAAADEFRDWADSADPAIPVIVISHLPIHMKRHDNHGGSAWNRALNYAATGSDGGTEIVRDVAFLFGHNHTVEQSEYNLEPGDSMQPEGDEEPSVIYYNYITAGYLRDLHTATMITIDDDTLSFTRYTGDPDSQDPSVPALLSTRDRVKYYNVTTYTGTGPAETQKILSGRRAEQPADPARDGYTFTGWYTDQDHTSLYDFSTEVTEDISLYAGWEEVSDPAGEDEEGEDTPSPDEDPPSQDDDPDSTDEEPVAPDEETVTPDEEPAAPDDDPDSPDDETVSPDDDPDSTDEEPVAPDDDPVSPDDDPDSADDETAAPDEETVSPDDDPDSPDDEPLPQDDEISSPDDDHGSQDGDTAGPRTGDDSLLILWSMLMIVSSAEAGILLLIRSRQRPHL